MAISLDSYLNFVYFLTRLLTSNENKIGNKESCKAQLRLIIRLFVFAIILKMSGEVLKNQDLIEHAVECSRETTKRTQLINGVSVGIVNKPENEYYVIGKDPNGVQLRRFSASRSCSETEVVDRKDDQESIFSVPLASWHLGRIMAIVDNAIDLIEDDIETGNVKDKVKEVATIIADASILEKH